jgi:hypothetical protein
MYILDESMRLLSFVMVHPTMYYDEI